MEHIRLSANEWKLMEQLWQKEPQTITQLSAAIRSLYGWTKHTVITMLNRLEAKGAVAYREGERARLYSTCISRSQAALEETETLLDRVYGGSLGLLVNSFVKQKGITEEERDSLLALLSETPARKKEE
ncbi:MAG: BlaI/MecI/CopY family transcriptional regulator [bacterium]|nr:BlaI/MecI/CopY family transcriptional regulator [bacterium]